MRVLVIGSGGREHALCWAIAASPLCDALYCAPGNPGIAAEATCVAVGRRRWRRASSRCAGASASISSSSAPRRRWSRAWWTGSRPPASPPSARAPPRRRSKAPRASPRTCARATASRPRAYRRFRAADAAKAYVARARRADRRQGRRARRRQGRHRRGDDRTRRCAAIDDALVGQRFGAAGAEVVIEDFLDGEEASFFALVDGAHALPLASAQDHKRVGDGDTGPNTGGMGAYSPAPCLTPALEDAGDGAHHPPDGRGDGGGRAALQGRALCRADADRRRARSSSNTMSASATPNARCCCRGSRATSCRRSSRRATACSRISICAGATRSALCVVLAAKGYPDDPSAAARSAGSRPRQPSPG